MNNDIYYNERDIKINKQNAHTTPLYTKEELLAYYNDCKITDLRKLTGLKRYFFENDGKAIGTTLQGAVYSAIDVITGRKVIVKAAKKKLVSKNVCLNGLSVAEDIKKEAKLLKFVSNDETSDAGISKFVDYFQDSKNYFLVCEHGGIELFNYVRDNYPEGVKNIKIIENWKREMRYHFRTIARAIYHLHMNCGTAHLDLSLENTVISVNDLKNGRDPVCRIIDFGLAQHYGINGNKNNDINNDINNNDIKKWKYDGCAGKQVYFSPEIQNIKIFLDRFRKARKNAKDNANKNGNNMYNNDDFLNIFKTVPKWMQYDPRSADVWALGVMLFIMLVGGQPWEIPHSSEETYNHIMDGNISVVLRQWDSEAFVDSDALDLMKKIFVKESQRVNIKQVLNHPYVKNAPRTLKKPKLTETSLKLLNNSNNMSGKILSPRQKSETPSSCTSESSSC